MTVLYSNFQLGHLSRPETEWDPTVFPGAYPYVTGNNSDISPMITTHWIIFSRNHANLMSDFSLTHRCFIFYFYESRIFITLDNLQLWYIYL